jgi:predicted RNA binding protein YcfA (HicA-like mRNA interferase family)
MILIEGVMNFRELEKIIKDGGWRLDRTKGSHYIYSHPIKPGTVIIPFHKGDLKRKTVRSAIKQAGLKTEEEA